MSRTHFVIISPYCTVPSCSPARMNLLICSKRMTKSALSFYLIELASASCGSYSASSRYHTCLSIFTPRKYALASSLPRIERDPS